MADQGSDKVEDVKRAAEHAAKVVLAKHPAVVAGSVPSVECRGEPLSPKPIDTSTRNIGRGLRR